MTVHIKTNVEDLLLLLWCYLCCCWSVVSLTICMVEVMKWFACHATNILGNLSGVICDGAKSFLCYENLFRIYSAFDVTMLALHKEVLQPKDGIVGRDIEATIKNVGELAQAGMKGNR